MLLQKIIDNYKPTVDEMINKNIRVFNGYSKQLIDGSRFENHGHIWYCSRDKVYVNLLPIDPLEEIVDWQYRDITFDEYCECKNAHRVIKLVENVDIMNLYTHSGWRTNEGDYEFFMYDPDSGIIRNYIGCK